MRKLVIFVTIITLGLFLVSCGGSTATTPTTTATTPSATTPAATTPASSTPTAPAIDAQALFTTNCAVCHGASRQGTPALNAPPLTPTSLADDSVASIADTITNGVNATAMLGWQGRLTSAQINALAQFVKTTPPPAAIDAAALYASKCATCHGPNRQGVGSTFPPLTPTSLADDSISAISGIISDGVPNTGMAAFKAQLSSDQISALATYLKNVAP